MSGQGYHFAIRREEALALLRADEMSVLEFAAGLVEGFLRGGEGCGGYKEWDVLHRLLGDGTFRPGGGAPPLNRCFLGGRLLVTEGAIVNLVLVEEVRETAAALSELGRAGLCRRFAELFAGGGVSPSPTGSAADWYCGLFEELERFYRQAEVEGKAVVFFTDDCLRYFQEPAARHQD